MKPKSMVRVMSALSLLLCLAFSLVSCNSGPKTELAQFKTEEGIYHYPNLPWHSTVEEVEAVTGWNVKDNFVHNLYYDREEGSLQSLYTVQDISIDGEQCIVELQFDPDGGLWCISIYIPVKTNDMPKRFKALEKELTKAFGKPDRANYDWIPEPSNIPPSKTPWSMVNWYVWDKDERLVNSCGLVFADNSDSGREEGYLVFGAKWKDGGFTVV